MRKSRTLDVNDEKSGSAAGDVQTRTRHEHLGVDFIKQRPPTSREAQGITMEFCNHEKGTRSEAKCKKDRRILSLEMDQFHLPPDLTLK